MLFFHAVWLGLKCPSSPYVPASSSGGGGSGISGAMNSGLPVSAAPLGGVGIPGVKVKFCRYYAKDKTCFYGEDCQFLHEDPSAAGAVHGGGGAVAPPAAVAAGGGGGGGSGSPVTLALAGGAVSTAAGAVAGYPLAANAVATCPSGAPAVVAKKSDALGPAGAPLDGQLLSSKFEHSGHTE